MTMTMPTQPINPGPNPGLELRRRNFLHGVATMAGLACIQGCRGSTRAYDRVGLGSKLDLRGKTLDGEFVALSDFLGQNLLVNLWATWCQPCIEELPLLDRLGRQRSDLTCVFVNQDRVAKHATVRKLRDDLKLTSTVMLDPAGIAAAKLVAQGYPTTVLLDSTGTVRWRRTGIIRENDPRFESALADLGPSTPPAPAAADQ